MCRTPGARTRVQKRQPMARDRAWQSMRILRSFTQPDLMATADISPANARKYVRGLERAGYLLIQRPRDSGRKGGHAIYRLVRDTGPKAPRMQSDGNTYDPNELKIYSGGIKK